MPARYYVSTAVPTTLSSSLGSTGNPSVAAITGWPASFPFTALIDWGLFSPGVAYQEAISVTSITGTGPYTLVCTRGIDGTSASAHNSGALVVHGVTAQDFSGPEDPWTPADNGWQLAICDPMLMPGAFRPSAGQLYLAGVQVRTGCTISNLFWAAQDDGSGSSSGSFAGIYNSAGTLLTGSSDIASLFTGGGNCVETPLTTPQTLTAGQFVWFAILWNRAVQQPSMFYAGFTYNPVVNFGMGNLVRTGVYGSGQTALPGSLTLSSISSTGSVPWVAGG